MKVDAKWPIKVMSGNWWADKWTRGKVFERQRKKKSEKLVAKAFCKKLLAGRKPQLPITVTLHRVAPRKLDDDNLETGFKYIRDEISRVCGQEDDSKIKWVYAQARGKPKEYSVVVQIESPRPE